MNARTLSILAVVLLFVPVRESAAQAEPTEAEMRGAIEDRFEIINANIADLLDRCRRRAYGDDPVMAMQCLALLAAGGGGRMEVGLTTFEKVACERAAGQPGYVCDYVIGTSSSSPFAQGYLGELMGAGSMGQGRFVRRSEGWLFISNADQ